MGSGLIFILRFELLNRAGERDKRLLHFFSLSVRDVLGGAPRPEYLGWRKSNDIVPHQTFKRGRIGGDLLQVSEYAIRPKPLSARSNLGLAKKAFAFSLEASQMAHCAFWGSMNYAKHDLFAQQWY